MLRPGPAALVPLLVACAATSAHGLELADPAAVRALCGLSDPAAVVAVGDRPAEGSAEAAVVQVDGALAHGDVVWAEGVAARDRAHARARVLLQAHVVDVVSSGFAFEPWDDGLGVLAVDVTDGVPLHGGAWVLDFEGTDRVLFDADIETAEDLIALRRMGSLSMRLVFELATADRPDLAWCTDRDDGSVGIAAHLVSAELVEPLTDRVRVRATTARFDAGRARYGVAPCGTTPPVEPAVEVARVLVSSDDGGAGEIGPILELYLEARLSDCYVQQLAENARLQGAMTVGFRIDDAGHGVDAEVLIDAVDSPDLTRCVLTAVDTLDLPGSGATSADVQMTVTFDPDGTPTSGGP